MGTHLVHSEILVINPTSSPAIGHKVGAGVDDIGRKNPSARIIVETMTAGPAGIKTQQDIDDAARLVLDRVRRHPDGIAVVACFADPGVAAVRGHFPAARILGCGEQAIREASRGGRRYGILSLSPGAAVRHRLMARILGVEACYLGSVPLSDNPMDASWHPGIAPLLQSAASLKTMGAAAIVIGCAGMGAFRDPLARAIGLPVIDPLESAVTQALRIGNATTAM
ncbi:aspartate/glutamate racemase family protein [Gluconacetobacter sacchari]|uniref:aspartate/glutamate racemase family protein n=1 Tax=Gluconacetobacter sacchari TaxID=92759 RepID=UPI0039B42E12